MPALKHERSDVIRFYGAVKHISGIIYNHIIYYWKTVFVLPHNRNWDGNFNLQQNRGQK